MNIHEHQAKEVLKSFGAPVAKGVAITSLDQAQAAIDALPGPLWVVKSQIHAGGRGKGKFKELGPDAKGGVRLAKTLEEVRANAADMLGNTLVTIQTGEAGKQVNRLYITDGADIAHEYYLSLLVDRKSSRIAMVVSTEGGMDIEAVAHDTPEKITKVVIDPGYGIADFQLRQLITSLQLTGNEAKNAAKLITEMEAIHRHTLELKASATQSKDVIKLNCVNENLLAVKQLLNIADEAKTEFTGAKIEGDRGEQVHQYGQITIASEKAKEAGNEAQACIGEELHFVGKNDVTVDGPAIPHDPTKDGDVAVAGGEDPYQTQLEDPAYASPFAPQ